MRSRLKGVVVALVSLAALVSSPAAALAQETPEQMKKAYEAAQEQLKAAQERKNQLAAENETLKANIADLQKQLASAHARMEDMKRVDADHAEQTFILRSHYMAWQTFVKTYPEVLTRWKAYLGNEFITAPTTAPSDVMDREWPMSIRM